MTTIEPQPATRKRGRPRSFDSTQVLDQAVDIFWRRGFHRVTTRELENEIGISQSSIYNTFGSKEELFAQALTRYQQRLSETVLSLLDRPDTDRETLLKFLDAVIEWVGEPEHPGCMVLNYGAESPDAGELLVAYRQELRRLLLPAIESITTDTEQARQRAELLVSAIMGLNVSARCGASRSELLQLGHGIARQIRDW